MNPSTSQPSVDPAFLYQREPRYFATCAPGLEEWGGVELEELGATEVQPGYRGFHFQADARALYGICYGARLFSRVLAPLVRFDCHHTKTLYRRAHDLPWEALLGLDHTFAVQAVTTHSTIRHARYAALCVKDAVADRFREREGRRPDVDARRPDVALHLYLRHNHAVLSLDLSGGSLHRRGYRLATVDAPLQETLAAAIVRASGWQGDRPLIDPFCGSGTLLCEAWMSACRIPAGYLRAGFGLAQLPDYDPDLWQSLRAEMDAHIAVPPGLTVRGGDRDPAAVAAARTNLAQLPGGDRVAVEQADADDLPGWTDAVIVTNPPYGVRLGDADAAAAQLGRFGDRLKQRCPGCLAYVYFGDDRAVKALGLKPDWKKELSNGGLDGRLCRYTLFAGQADRARFRSLKQTG